MMSTELEKILKAIATSSEQTKKQLEDLQRDLKQQIVTENDKLRELLDKETKKVKDLELKCHNLERKNTELERKLRKNNLIIFGLKSSDEKQLLQDVLTFFKEKILITVEENEINNVYLLKGAANKSREPEEYPIKVEFVSYRKKSQVFSNAPKLKGTRIFIAHDLSFEDRKEQKILQTHLKSAKLKKYDAKIFGNKLIINGETFTVNDLSERELTLPEEEFCDSAVKSSSLPNTPTINQIEQFFKNNYKEIQPKNTGNPLLNEKEEESTKRDRDSICELNNTIRPSTKKTKPNKFIA